jgi:putative effector of murein hydrolase
MGWPGATRYRAQMAPDESPQTARAVWDTLARHPVITAVFVVCTVLGAVLGLTLLPVEWSVARRLAGGAVAGAGAGLLITVTKMFD